VLLRETAERRDRAGDAALAMSALEP
jgi:hypothetical protein